MKQRPWQRDTAGRAASQSAVRGALFFASGPLQPAQCAASNHLTKSTRMKKGGATRALGGGRGETAPRHQKGCKVGGRPSSFLLLLLGLFLLQLGGERGGVAARCRGEREEKESGGEKQRRLGGGQ